MEQRPAIGARVRVRGNTGIPNIAGRCGTVVAHHPDGVAVHVELETGPFELVLCDASDVEPVTSHA
jgi:hypothetical protein